MDTRDFTNTDREIIQDLYSNAPRTLDDLPYTYDFENLYDEFLEKTGKNSATRHDVWRLLTTLRKRSALPRKRR